MYWPGLGKLNRMFVPLNCPNLWLGFHTLDHISVPWLFLQALPLLSMLSYSKDQQWNNDSQARGRNVTQPKGA